MVSTEYINQSKLVNNFDVRIHNSMDSKFAALEITSPQKLTDDKIKQIALIAYDYTTYTYENRPSLKSINAQLDQLSKEKISFTVYGAAYDQSARNIQF